MVPIRVGDGQTNRKVRERGGGNEGDRQTDRQTDRKAWGGVVAMRARDRQIES